MKEKLLYISSDLSLPLELAARTQCIFAQKGAGKTYAAGVQAEEMLAGGVQVCILDPTGVWWGLQSSAKKGEALADRGLAVKVDGGYVISAAGIALLGADYTRAPAGGQAALTHWLKKLPDYESKMLEAISRHPRGLDEGAIAIAIDRSLTSSAFPKAIRNLISLNFITAQAPYQLAELFK